MSDYIIRGMAADGQVRFFAGTTKKIVETARSIHNTSPVATAALGRLLTAGALMGAACKNDSDLLTLQIQCSGPIGGLTVTADAHCNVKGYVNNPEVILHANEKGKLDVAKALDMGVLSVIKDIGLKEPYVGQTQLITGEIAEDLTYYFATSEQVPSSVALGVLMNKDNTVRQAGGFIIQLLPDASDEIIDRLEAKLSGISSITSLLDAGKTPEEILTDILGEFGLEILKKMPVQFHCDCERSRVEKAIISIGRKEIQDMIDEGKEIEVNCQFCNKHYEFSVDELKKLYEKAKK